MRDVSLFCTVNGKAWSGIIDNRMLLLEFVRDVAGLKGARSGCMTGDCGACSVLVDGRVTKSCIMLAASVDEREVTTIEGAASLSVIQAAFVSEHGFQCGFCTTGMVLTAAELLAANRTPTDEEIRWALCGNLCRCTGYDSIVAAVRHAAAALVLSLDGSTPQRK